MVDPFPSNNPLKGVELFPIGTKPAPPFQPDVALASMFVPCA
jgi:hypothetical protein